MGKKFPKFNASRITQMIAAVSIIFGIGLIATPMFVYASGSTNTVSATLGVPTYCVPEISNTAITFPQTQQGGFAGTDDGVLVNNIGTTSSNVWVQGTSWADLANTFNVGNTLWNPTNVPGSATGNALTGSAADTHIITTANTIGQGFTGNNIFFGLNVPSSAIGGTYTQTITISESC